MAGEHELIGFTDDPRSLALARWISETHRVQREAIVRGDRYSPPTPIDELSSAWDEFVPYLPTYFDFYRPPLIHQLRDHYRFRDQPYFALFYEQRARKTKVVLDIFRYRYTLGHLDGLLVIAYPNGTHRIWVDESVKDFPPEFIATFGSLAYSANRFTTKAGRADAEALLNHDGPIMLTMNCEALNTPNGWKYVEAFVARRRCVVVADESSWGAAWSARTKKLLALGGFFDKQRQSRPNVMVKAILDGTPVDEGPEELYFPVTFLRKGALGFGDKASFTNRYCEYEEEVDEYGVTRRVQKMRRDGNTYEVFKGYRNLDELYDRIAGFSSRVLRRDVGDAPEKTYVTRYFKLTPAIRAVYDELHEKYAAELSDGTVVRARDVLLRMTRLQMVARNFYPPERYGVPCGACFESGFTEDGDDCAVCAGIGMIVTVTDLKRIDARNPAAEVLVDEITRSREPFVVWCRFHQDVTDATEALAAAGLTTWRYDGMVPETERERGYQAFRSGERDGIVGTILSGLSRGKDLSRARIGAYYSNEFSLRARRQSEDRTEGLDRTISTGIIDIVAEDTRDIDVISALRDKRSIAERIMRDLPTRWL